MRKPSAWALIAALIAAPLRAAIVLAPAAPAPVLPTAALPAAAPAALPTALSAPALSAPVLLPAAAAAPAVRPLPAFVAEHAARPLAADVFIQQEHEGTLLSPDPRDSSGNVFRYYAPAEMRPGLAAETEGGLRGLEKAVYAVRRALQLKGRGTLEGAWDAWPLSAKLDYLDRLEKAVTAERGPGAAWDGKVSLVMKRGPGAPDFVTPHPHMEAPPPAYAKAVGARFLQPEIVSAKDSPASSVEEALGRARRVIADTGHAGVQFHVFVKAAPEVLLAQMDRLDSALQTVNDALFARAASESELNIAHPSLGPWHRGRSGRVRALLESRDPKAHVPDAADPDSEKHAFVGLRYWGMEDGKAVVSFELRGAGLPWRKPPSTLGRGMETAETPRRDYAPLRTSLTLLALYAEAAARGEAPAGAAPSVRLDAAAADAYLRERARALGLPDGAFDGLDALARRLTGAERAPQGYLLPFASAAQDPEGVRAFADAAVSLASRLKADADAGREGNARQNRYLFWSAYQEWARRHAVRQEARLESLARASAER